MAELPRKPTFPPFMIDKIIQKIQKEVQENVIPVSTGIYSYEKLKQKLQAIPKPQLEDYDDKIFYDVLDKKTQKNKQKCPICFQDYTTKNQAIMCCFCGVWNCSQCLCHRKRPHPRSKDTNGQRYDICVRCDTKFLNLQLNHSYVQKRSLLQEAIIKVTKMLDYQINQHEQQLKSHQQLKSNYEKNKFKISQMKKQKFDLEKITKRQKGQLQDQHKKNQIAKQKFIEAHIRKVEHEQKVRQFQKQQVISDGVQLQQNQQMLENSKGQISMDDILNGKIQQQQAQGLGFLNGFQNSEGQDQDQDQFHKSVLKMNRNTRHGGNFQDRNTYRQALNFDDYIPDQNDEQAPHSQSTQLTNKKQEVSNNQSTKVSSLDYNGKKRESSEKYKEAEDYVQQQTQKKEQINYTQKIDEKIIMNQPQVISEYIVQQAQRKPLQIVKITQNEEYNQPLFTFKQNLEETTANSFPNYSYFVQQAQDNQGISIPLEQDQDTNKKQQIQIGNLLAQPLPKLNLSHFRTGYNQSYVQKEQKEKLQPQKMTLSNYQQKKKYAQIIIEEPKKQQFTFSQSAISPKSNSRTDQSLMQQYFRESYRTNQHQNEQSFIRMQNQMLCENFSGNFEDSIVKDQPCQSQIDQEELKNAKHNLIKAARQSAMQSRKFQQQDAPVVVNKCQCTIY